MEVVHQKQQILRVTEEIITNIECKKKFWLRVTAY